MANENEAPYRRIVADIRDRVARGELKPGDRAPSTRDITREWGVAMATATKVIAALRAEGLVDTRPGAGTVVRPTDPGRAEPPRRGAPRDVELSRERVVRAAVAVADAEGTAMVSMRRVATDLGVATMSLYRHVSNKDELLLLMVNEAFAEQPFPDRVPDDWRARVETAGRLMWTVFRRHPWAAEILSLTRPQILPALMPYSEWSLGALYQLGLSATDMMYAHLTLFGHVRGMALSLQSELQARQDTGLTMNEWMETQDHLVTNVIQTAQFPALQYVVEQGFEYDLDEVFEFGLCTLLDAVAVRAGQPPNRPDRAR